MAFAAEELQRYLTLATGRKPDILLSAYSRGQDGLWLGTAESFPDVDISVSDAVMDDAIHVETAGWSGVIAGINPRSVLLATYRYLSNLGCRWVRPGVDGQYVPRITLESKEVSLRERPSYRHRAICIEGSVSYEHLRDIIDWAPKAGFNGYYIQSTDGYEFFDRWYSQEARGGGAEEAEGLPIEQAEEYARRAVGEIGKRSLLFHKVGHGWTSRPFGIEEIGSEQRSVAVPESVVPYLAQVNGKRELWQGVPGYTNLCYSNPEVRNRICRAITDYAQKHPEVDLLHFWLADGTNNHCECVRCRKSRPADFYVTMLNELDELLRGAHLPTKIVFLIYVDLLWPPESQRIQNPDRFILMFAPITRSYSEAFAASESSTAIPPYKRNRLRMPRNVDENIAFLKQWQSVFHGDSFDFDYHFMWDHYKDPGYTQIAEILHKDLKHLAAIGLNGLVSCQVQRAFFPTGLGMTVMGRTLWNRDQRYDEMVEDYYTSAFGPRGMEAHAYLERLTTLFDPGYIRGEKPGQDSAAADSFRQIPKVVQSFMPEIERNINTGEKVWASSWRYLRSHSEIVKALAGALEAKARGDSEAIAGCLRELERIVSRLRDQIHPVFDGWEFMWTVNSIFDEERSDGAGNS